MYKDQNNVIIKSGQMKQGEFKLVRDINKIVKDKEYIMIISDLINQDKVQEMKMYRQHHKINCFEHCLFVSYNTYLICKKYHLDYISAARAGMLHDLFLYDWRKRQDGRKGLHAFTHGKKAYEEASTFLNLNDKEKDMIIKHMWPVTPAIPKYKETFIITLVDKYFAVAEAFIKIKNHNEILKREKEKIVK